MKLTKEIIKRMIKEELKSVREAYMGPMGPRGRGGYKPKPTAPSDRMAPDVAMAMLDFGWEELPEEMKQKIEALAQSLSHSSDSGKDPAFRAHSKDQYDKLIAAIAKAKGE